MDALVLSYHNPCAPAHNKGYFLEFPQPSFAESQVILIQVNIFKWNCFKLTLKQYATLTGNSCPR